MKDRNDLSAEERLEDRELFIRKRPVFQTAPSLTEYDREIIYLPSGGGKYTRLTLYTPLSEAEKESRKRLNPNI